MQITESEDDMADHFNTADPFHLLGDFLGLELYAHFGILMLFQNDSTNQLFSVLLSLYMQRLIKLRKICLANRQESGYRRKSPCFVAKRLGI